MNGADIAARERTGRTALDTAVQSSKLDTAFVVLCVASSFEAHRDSGHRFMASTIESRNFGAIKILMDHRVPLRVGKDVEEALKAQIDDITTVAPISMPQGLTTSF